MPKRVGQSTRDRAHPDRDRGQEIRDVSRRIWRARHEELVRLGISGDPDEIREYDRHRSKYVADRLGASEK